MIPEMATTYHGGGSQSPTSLSKPIERVFEDAQHTGEILLSCRKLREYPKMSAKYDLVDTISADVSKNRLSELPKELCSYISMEKLNCYHNVIKSIPECIIQLQALTFLNLSRNQLSIIPSFISQICTLEVLIVSHNKLVSLPEEVGVLDKLMELDVSCNEISQLPVQIGDLKSLKSLNVRRNLLQELPVEISKLNLRKLDISANRISKIPTVFRKIETLEEIILHNNPLTLPPSHVCTKGKQHIMKYLQITAIREEKARMGMLSEMDMKRFRKSLPPGQSVSSEEFRTLSDTPDKWKRHTVLSSDSGYSTTDSVDKCGWSPQEITTEPPHLIESNNLAIRAAAAVCNRDPRFTRTPPDPPQRLTSHLSTENLALTSIPAAPQSTHSQYSQATPNSYNIHKPAQTYSQPSFSNSVNQPTRTYSQPPYNSNLVNTYNNNSSFSGSHVTSSSTSSSSTIGGSPVATPDPLSPNATQFPSSSVFTTEPSTDSPPYVPPRTLFSHSTTPPTLFPVTRPAGFTPTTPDGAGNTAPGLTTASPGVGPSKNAFGSSLEDEFTRELQRQKLEYESKKKIAEQLRIQHEEQEERERRRLAAQRVQEEQQALLSRQREVKESKPPEAYHTPEVSSRNAMDAHQPDIGQAPVPSPDISHNRDGVAHRNETNFYFTSRSSQISQSGTASQVWPPPPQDLAQPPVAPAKAWAPPPRSPGQSSTAPGVVSNVPNRTYYSVSSTSDQFKQRSAGRDLHNHSAEKLQWNPSGANSNSRSQQEIKIDYMQPDRTANYSSNISGNPAYRRDDRGHGPLSPLAEQETGSFNAGGTGYDRRLDQSNIHRQNPGPMGAAQNSYLSYNTNGNQYQSREGPRQPAPYSHLASACRYSNSGTQSANSGLEYNSSGDSYNQSASDYPGYKGVDVNRNQRGYLGNGSPGDRDNSFEGQGRFDPQYDPSERLSGEHYGDHRKPQLSSSGSFKDERPVGQTGPQVYRRTVSDSSTRLPATSQPLPVANGIVHIETTGNSSGSSPSTLTPGDSGPTPSLQSPVSHPAPYVLQNGPTVTDTHMDQQISQPPGIVTRRPKGSPGDAGSTGVTAPQRGVKPSPQGHHPGTGAGRGASDGEHRLSNSSVKSQDGLKPKTESRLRSIQKDGVHDLVNRRSTGSTSSEDDRKRSTPTRSLPTATSVAAASKRSGSGMSNSPRTAMTATSRTTVSTTSRVAPPKASTTGTPGGLSRPGVKPASGGQTGGARIMPPHASGSARGLQRRDSTSSTTSVSSSVSTVSTKSASKIKTSLDKTKRSGTVLTSAHVKMLDDYSKEALHKQHGDQQHTDFSEQIEQLRKTISTRLKRTLPDNLLEALSDGVLLCHLANQIRPRSVASVHVPSPAVPKLTLPKCRKNVENFLEACRKIGIPKDQMCDPADILAGKGLHRVAGTVAALVAKHPKQTEASLV
ncbi:serine-rich adhesin for platelets-like [Dreissena polymorpha]|nr:serine-rich adhesin for platelets-like [Dreissena polymorpha]